MTTEEKAKAYDEALKQAKKELNTCGSLDCDAARQIFRFFPELHKEEKPLTPFQQRLSCILRGVYYAEVPYKEVKEFILKVVRTRTDELVELAKKHEYADCQLRESEDERIRKFLLDYAIEMIAGLESDISRSTYDGIKGHDPDAEAELTQWQKSRAYLEKRKEQKPVEPSGKLSREEYLYQLLIDQLITYSDYEYLTGKNPAWSEEDEIMLDAIIRDVMTLHMPYPKNLDELKDKIDFLKSFRPPQDRCKDCPHRGDMFLLTQGIKSGRHELAIEFMNYLDENRPYGKMGLSNGECEDIDKAFNECDWAKIMRYVEKYSPQPKQEWSEKHIADIFEKVGLAKIVREQGNDNLTNALQSAMIELASPVEWSEEDEKMLKKVMSICELSNDKEAIWNWLCSKVRDKSIRPKPKQEWSEEDEDIFNNIIEKAKGGHWIEINEIAWLIDHFKFFRTQPKVELTLLDENIINAAVAFVEQNDHFNYWRGIDKHTVIKALRSIKPHWKPTEEQMKVFQNTMQRLLRAGGTGKWYAILESLYKQLKKL